MGDEGFAIAALRDYNWRTRLFEWYKKKNEERKIVCFVSSWNLEIVEISLESENLIITSSKNIHMPIFFNILSSDPFQMFPHHF